MLTTRHKSQKLRPRFSLKWKRYGRRVSTVKHPGIFLVENTTDTVGDQLEGIHPTANGVKTFEVNQFYLQSSDSSRVNVCYDALKPFLFIMRALGVFPVTYTAGGAVVFSWLSLQMLYSVCVYVLLCVAVWITNGNRMQTIREAKGRFEESVDAYMLFVFLVPLVYLPFTRWGEASKVAKYLNDWNIFQVRYRQVTGRSLVIPLKCRCLTGALLAVGLSHVSILAGQSLVYISVDRIPDVLLYSYLITLSNLTGLYWYFNFAALSCTAVRLGDSLSEALDARPTHAAVLAQFRLLWLDLSRLATHTGAVSCYTCGCYLVHQFFMVALSAYATLSDVISDSFDSDLLVTSCTVSSAFMIFAICEGGHNVVVKTEFAFQEKLLRLQTAFHSKTTRSQVKAFLQTITAQPPVISLGGYVRIDRHLLIGFGSTMVTYLIVLLQLKFSVAGTSQNHHVMRSAAGNAKTVDTK